MTQRDLAIAALSVCTGFLFALFTIGLFVHYGATEASVLNGWQEVGGALIAAGATIAAILIANRATKANLDREIGEMRDQAAIHHEKVRNAALCALHGEVSVVKELLGLVHTQLSVADASSQLAAQTTSLRLAMNLVSALPSEAYRASLSVLGGEEVDLRLRVTKLYSRANAIHTLIAEYFMLLDTHKRALTKGDLENVFSSIKFRLWLAERTLISIEKAVGPNYRSRLLNASTPHDGLSDSEQKRLRIASYDYVARGDD